MSETSSLTDALQRAHAPAGVEDYSEYVAVETDQPIQQGRNGRIGRVKGVPKNPDRVKSKYEYDEARDGDDYSEADAAGKLLHNATRPPVVIQQERPEHRFLVFLYAQGMSTKDIFLQLGGEWDSARNLPISGTAAQYSYQHLHTIRRQAWFQTKLIEYMEQCGKDVIRAKFEAELMPSIDKVISIRDDASAPKQLQLRAAESLIDRFLGKPIQQVVALPVASVEKYEKDAASLAKETDAIEAELKNLNAAFLTNDDND